MNVLVYKFRDDIPPKLAAFERTAHDYENQSTKTVDDDIKIPRKRTMTIGESASTGRVQTETERPCRRKKETGGNVATSTRRSSNRAVAVLAPRRERLVNVCHGHALREQQIVLFQ